jgi:FtsZ-interacting cell division protein YlmF
MPYDSEAEEYEDDDESGEARTSWFSNITRFMHTWNKHHEDEDLYDDEPTQSSKPFHGDRQQRDLQSVARMPAPSRLAGGSLNPIRRPATISQLHLERERPCSVTVRRSVQSFEDARRAVDGLRDDVQQIINIEQTPPDIAERLIDFLNGATYALDGSVEKIGTQVYLFTPKSVSIDVEEKAKTGATKAFFDH